MRLPGVQEVVGSNPASPTRIKKFKAATETASIPIIICRASPHTDDDGGLMFFINRYLRLCDGNAGFRDCVNGTRGSMAIEPG